MRKVDGKLRSSTGLGGQAWEQKQIMIDYLSGLNEKQREAVLHIEGPLMIVAGAGSGKTKVLTTRSPT